jgi:hypothetical protein
MIPSPALEATLGARFCASQPALGYVAGGRRQSGTGPVGETADRWAQVGWQQKVIMSGRNLPGSKGSAGPLARRSGRVAPSRLNWRGANPASEAHPLHDAPSPIPRHACCLSQFPSDDNRDSRAPACAGHQPLRDGSCPAVNSPLVPALSHAPIKE